MKTLQEDLQARLTSDARAHLAAIENRNGSIRLIFGAFAGHDRIELSVEGNRVSVIRPGEPSKAIPLPVDPKAHSKEDLLRLAVETGADFDADAAKPKIADAINSKVKTSK